MKNLKFKKVFAMILCMGMVLSFCSCTNGVSEASNGKKNINKSVDTFFNSIKKQDEEKLKEVYLGDNIEHVLLNSDIFGVEDKKVMQQVKNKMLDFDYSIKETEEKGNKAFAKIEINTYNFGESYNDATIEMIKKDYLKEGTVQNKKWEEGIIKITQKHLLNAQKSYKGEFNLSLKKKDDKWYVSEVDDFGDFFNGILGGFFDIMLKGENYEDIYKAMDEDDGLYSFDWGWEMEDE